MPMTYTMELVERDLELFELDTSGTDEEKRERLAKHFEGDVLAAWEVRTGRPWTAMTQEEAIRMYQDHPEMRRNPAILRVAAGLSVT